jgi:uncharacterized protein YggE
MTPLPGSRAPLQTRLQTALLTLLVVLGLLVAFLLGNAGGAPAQAAPVYLGDQPAARAAGGAIKMTGVGKATVVPDQLTFSLSVTDKQTDLDQALSRSSATMKRVIAVLGQHGVKSSDVQTTGLQMYPTYDYHSYGPPTLTGYRVTQRASVVVHDLAEGGKAISAAIGAGGNGVRATNIRLGVSDPEAALAKARKAAVDQATEKAQEYADATGQTLGTVVSIREGRSSRPVRHELYNQRATFDMAGAVALPIKAGKDDLSVKVSVVWTFSD